MEKQKSPKAPPAENQETLTDDPGEKSAPVEKDNPPAAVPGGEAPAEKGGEQSPPPTSKKPAAESSEFADIGAAFSEVWPEAKASFVDAVKAESKAAEDRETAAVDFRLLKDSQGKFYDPALCSTRIDPATGLPEKSKKGMWILRKGVKRSQLKNRPPKIEQDGAQVAAEQITAEAAARLEAEKKGRAEVNAKVGMAAFMQLSTFAHGPEAVNAVLGMVLARVKDANGKEHSFGVYDLHEMSLSRLLEAMDGGPELSPGVQCGLVFGLSSLAMYFQREERREAAKGGFSRFLAYWKGRRDARKQRKAAGAQK